LNRFLKYHFPLILACIAIFIESSIPNDAFPKLDFELSDKIIHFIIYFVLFILFYISLNNQNKFVFISSYSLLIALFFTLIYGAGDEIHQYFVPNRTCDLYDWISDAVGALSAYIILIFIIKYKTGINSKHIAQL